MATMLALSGILFTGDSDIAGWATAAEWPKSVNLGVGGATCGDVAKKAEAHISTYAPSVVVLVCGENDLAYGASVAKTMKRLTKAVDRLASGGARVIFIGTKPEPSTKSLHKKYRKYDQKVRALTRDGNLYTFIDSYGGFEALGNPNSLYKGDKLHLSEEGYALWTAWTKAAIDGSVCVRGSGTNVEYLECASSCPPDKWSAKKCGRKCAGAKADKCTSTKKAGKKCRSKCKTTCGECA